ncbi:hypothetical protein [Piscinibacter sp.]|uniref:hypothetical protein n=1 Tax=Piscinibacter sp. TaxID=1903157 RepID=UPI002C5EDB7E|nr:hypothetical protein [Albitalea sp.]HUG24493.1 hypothetical protein [Albitalea sp.]
MTSTIKASRVATATSIAALALSMTLAALPGVAHAQAAAAMATQSSSEQGVTLKVTPKSVGLDNPRWEFAVVLDTHSSDLSDDLATTATLITADGREFKPVAWTGAAPGGHHREGVLEFAVPQPWPRAVELKLKRESETAARSFRWEF